MSILTGQHSNGTPAVPPGRLATWPSSTSTASARSTHPSCSRRGRRRTCTSAASRRSGPRADLRRVPRAHPLAPRSSSPATARSSPSRRWRTGRPLLGRRSATSTSVPRSPHRAARAGQRGAAAQPRRPHLLPTARPHEAAVGDVARRGPGEKALLAGDQDPPLPRRRRGGDRSHVHALRSRPGAPPGRAEEDWLPAPEPSGAQLLVGSLQAWVDTAPRDRRRPAPGGRPSRAHAGAGCARRRSGVGEVAWAGLDPAARDPAHVRHRPPPALRRGARRGSTSSRRSRTPSAGP